jgi:DNA end-binding protein Ku
MPRALWTGSLSFGLVNVPIELHSAVRDRGLHFHQLHDRTMSPIEVHRFCSKEGIEVDLEEIGHGYPLDGRMIVLTDEELAAAAPRKTRTIDIEQFAELEEVDPVYFDHPYVLLPAAGGSEGILRAYRLLHDVMADTEKVAIGRFVLRSKEYLTAIRADAGVLALSTMRFHDEVRPASVVDAPTGAKQRPSKKELDRAVALIESMSRDFEPDRWKDRYRERLRALVARKAKGEAIEPARPQRSPRATPDLMAALERSIAEMERQPA